MSAPRYKARNFHIFINRDEKCKTIDGKRQKSGKSAENRQKCECKMKTVFVSAKKIFIVSAAAVIAATIIAILSATGSYAVFFGYASRKLPVYYVKTDEKKLAISFDCAWGVDYTDALLSVMQAEGVKCTFFCVEFWAEKYPETLKKIYERGHEVETHSATHPHMAKMSKAEIKNELLSSCNAIENTLGVRPTLFRPPFGEYNDTVIDAAEECGLIPIQWSVDSLDWKNISAKAIVNRVVKKASAGAIVLFHNQGLHTAEALPLIIKTLKSEGYKFVPIGELIYRDNYKIAPDGAQIKTD